MPGLTLFDYENNRESAYWLFGFHVERRDEFILAMKNAGITSSVVHLGIDHNSVFGGTQKSLVNQLKFNKTQIHIPLHDALSNEQVEYIINTIQKGW